MSRQICASIQDWSNSDSILKTSDEDVHLLQPSSASEPFLWWVKTNQFSGVSWYCFTFSLDLEIIWAELFDCQVCKKWRYNLTMSKYPFMKVKCLKSSQCPLYWLRRHIWRTPETVGVSWEPACGVTEQIILFILIKTVIKKSGDALACVCGGLGYVFFHSHHFF